MIATRAKIVSCAAVMVAAAAAVFAFNPQPDPPGHFFGMLTINHAQGARLYVGNLAWSGASSELSADAGRELPPNPCVAVLSFVDQFGQVLARSEEIVHPGRTATLEYVPPPTGELPAVQIRGIARRGAENCVSNVEVVDGRSGQSHVVLNPAVIRGFNPQPDPPGGKQLR
jgi:hypothetical protein